MTMTRLQQHKLFIALKGSVIQWLKSAAVKAALLRFLGSSISGGWKAFVVKFIVTELFEEIAEPIVRYAFREMGYAYNRIEGEVVLKKIKQAKKEDNEEDYNTHLDGAFK